MNGILHGKGETNSKFGGFEKGMFVNGKLHGQGEKKWKKIIRGRCGKITYDKGTFENGKITAGERIIEGKLYKI